MDGGRRRGEEGAGSRAVSPDGWGFVTGEVFIGKNEKRRETDRRTCGPDDVAVLNICRLKLWRKIGPIFSIVGG